MGSIDRGWGVHPFMTSREMRDASIRSRKTRESSERSRGKRETRLTRLATRENGVRRLEKKKKKCETRMKTPRGKYETQEYSPKTESISLAERETLRKGRRGRTTVPVPYDPFLSRLGCGGGVDIKIPRRNLGIKLIGREISNLG